jgi:hypothetical protein
MTTATATLRCIRCQKPLPAADADEVAVEQGTSSNLLYIHKGGCAAKYVRRST